MKLLKEQLWEDMITKAYAQISVWDHPQVNRLVYWQVIRQVRWQVIEPVDVQIIEQVIGEIE